MSHASRRETSELPRDFRFLIVDYQVQYNTIQLTTRFLIVDYQVLMVRMILDCSVVSALSLPKSSTSALSLPKSSMSALHCRFRVLSSGFYVTAPHPAGAVKM